mmetsp:Transcript_11579/g.32801  ORF Transcript_11579/g.32801 Transcript_11579/m.32801 type:complete len:250 (+) Transcript_11579:1301-2050(+)
MVCGTNSTPAQEQAVRQAKDRVAFFSGDGCRQARRTTMAKRRRLAQANARPRETSGSPQDQILSGEPRNEGERTKGREVVEGERGRLARPNTASSLDRLLLLLLETRLAVDHANVELLGAVKDLLALALGNVVGDLGAVRAVVHEEKLDVLGGADGELVEAAGEKVARALVRTIADVHLGASALEAAAEAGVNTAGSAPRLANAHKAVRLPPLDLLVLLLHDLDIVDGLGVGHLGWHLELQVLLLWWSV